MRAWTVENASTSHSSTDMISFSSDGDQAKQLPSYYTPIRLSTCQHLNSECNEKDQVIIQIKKQAADFQVTDILSEKLQTDNFQSIISIKQVIFENFKFNDIKCQHIFNTN